MTRWMTARRRLAAGMAVLALGVATATMRAQVAPAGEPREDLHGEQPGRSDRFGRMFHLPPFAEPTPAIRAALVALGARGGLLDARDQLSAGPVALIVDPLLNLANPNNDTETAGMTFLGQFLDHDMTFDTGSRLGQPANPRRSLNARRPYFDLDSLYGAGPAASPLLYDPADPARLRIESGGMFEDLPREPSGRAIIADPRNDENVILAGLQAALILAHNHAVDVVRAAQPDLDTAAVFDEARRQLTWHYQWIIAHEFLPQVAGRPLVERLLANGTEYYRPERDDAFIPVEFQIAYRMGHSMVRPSYRSNFTGSGGAPTFALVFDPAQEGAVAPADLRGGVRGPSRFVGWSTFFRFPGLEADVRPNKRLDTHLSTPLFDLPLGAIAAGAPPLSLAERNLLRHLTWMVPSGQAIAARMGVPALGRAQLSELAAVHPRFTTATPLWYYVLKEAEVAEQGLRLGPLGARLVAEVFVGLLQSDSTSFLHAGEPFVPSFGATPGVFTMVDLLNFAGVGGRR